MSPEPFYPLLDRLSEEQFAGGYWSFPEYCARVREEAAKLSNDEAAEVVTAWLTSRNYPRDRLPPALLRAYAQGPKRRTPAEAEELRQQSEQRDSLVLTIGLLLGGKIFTGMGFTLAFVEASGIAMGFVGIGLFVGGLIMLFSAGARLLRLISPPAKEP